ncbi:MAG: tryptophan synthase subunit alpha [Acidobacteriota bacterium]|nr:tryptophan synthase subunit alpha [Acidobacteriota bacterium]
MSRLADTFARLRRDKAPGLVTYVTAGDPDLEASAAIVRAIDAAGADIIELGVPFSDPIADGPVIQRASERALRAGGSLARTLALVSALRADVRAPIVLFTYANPVLRMGVDAFVTAARAAGVDGALLLDLPLEEAGEFGSTLSASGIDLVCLLSPTSTPERIAQAAAAGRGFLYVISRLGVTGARADMAGGAGELVGRIRSQSDLPIALGFGLSTPAHVRAACEHADAAVVGSALVQTIERAASAGQDPAGAAGDFVTWLKTSA